MMIISKPIMVVFRPVEQMDPKQYDNTQPFRYKWVKAKGKLPNEKRLHSARCSTS